MLKRRSARQNSIEQYGFTGNVDRFEEFEYISPATVLQSTGMLTPESTCRAFVAAAIDFE